jgi:hypothetical protein
MTVVADSDPSLDALRDLDGQVFVLDPKGAFWVKFEVRRLPATAAKPHGLDYSLTLHGSDGERLAGFDNAHAIAGRSPARRKAWDHRHRFRTIQPYDYSDAATLLEDFWRLVDAVLIERGARP